jgi:hypothetical protein
MATDHGLPSMSILLVLMAWLAHSGIRSIKMGRMRVLRSAGLVASAVPFMHGFVDVPLHREGILWASALLYAVHVPFDRLPSRRGAAILWRGLGLFVGGLGAWLIHGALTGELRGPVARTEASLTEAAKLFRLDVESIKGGEVTPENGDRLVMAMGLLDEAMTRTPMEGRLHGLHGMLALHFDDLDDRARVDFERHRVLDPTRVNLPLLQADAWCRISEEETTELWVEALRRASAQREVRGGDPQLEVQTFQRIVAMAAGNRALEDACFQLAQGRVAFESLLLARLPRTSLLRNTGDQEAPQENGQGAGAKGPKIDQ